MKILSYIRSSKFTKGTSIFLVTTMLLEVLAPLQAFALTSGPGQEEFTSFEPASTTDLVDPYTGSFTYNIPLISVPGPDGGYPINLSYHSGISMDQEASWVGLGWALNVGAINRQLRGLPDDYKGVEIKMKYHLRPSVSVGLDLPQSASELFGIGQQPYATPLVYVQGMQLGFYYNNYKGMGITVNYSVPFGAKMKDSPLAPQLGISFDSQNGIGLNPGLSIKGQNDKISGSFSVSASINSREGFMGVNCAGSASYTKKMTLDDHNKTNSKSGFGFGASSSLSFNPNSSLPRISMPITGQRVDFDIKMGYDLLPNNPIMGPMFGTGEFNSTPPLNWSGYVDISKAVENQTVKAYGFLHSTNNNNDNSAMQDFSSSPVQYTKNTPFLGTGAYTYDLFSSTGQGMAGMFRAYRSDIGVLSERKVENRLEGHRVVTEVGVSGTAPDGAPTITGVRLHVGLGYINNATTQSSGPWRGGNDLTTTFTDNSIGSDYQKSYMKMYGEKSSILKSTHPLYKANSTWDGEKAVRIGLVHTKIDKRTNFATRKDQSGSDFYVETNTAILPTTNSAVKSNASDYSSIGYRTPRSSYIQYLTGMEAYAYGFSKNLKYTVLKNNGTKEVVDKYPVGHIVLDKNIISEVVVTQADGTRYIYGLAANNLSTTEKLMSVQPDSDESPELTGLVKHPRNGTAPKDFSDHSNSYMTEKTSPSYAYTWMLTGVVSSDYIDVTGDGITRDDYGYWVKFDYTKTSGTQSGITPYNWRMPFSRCNFVENIPNTDKDDLGSITYGTKEMYYLTSVETKTHKAIFDISKRKDGYEAKPYSVEADGGINYSTDLDGNSSYKLNNISLYALDASGATGTTPINTVHFKYNYSLCQGVNNNNGSTVLHANESSNLLGKLTLEKVWTTYENSTKGAQNPYKFDYNLGDVDCNPGYSITKYDRWGNYRATDYTNRSTLRPEISYVNQRADYDANRHKHASAWNLRKVIVPTGSELNIDYEQNDYAYVENRRAMEMCEIIGIKNTDPNTDGYHGIKLQVNDDRAYAIAKLNRPLPGGTSAADLKRLLIGDEKWLYYRVYMRLCPDIGCANPNSVSEDYVSGYAEIDPDYNLTPINLTGGTAIEAVQIPLKKVPLHPKGLQVIKVHPFRKAGLVHVRLDRSEITRMVEADPNDAALQIIGNLLSSIPDLIQDLPQMLVGTENWLAVTNYCNEIVPGERSMIRLVNPTSKKYGGGARVKRIYFKDTWKETAHQAPTNQPSLDETLVYGLDYNYTINENGKLISSGVAYEPNVGGEESALRQCIPYESSFTLKTNFTLFAEKPLLNDYYPGQSVGYRQVTVKSLTNTNFVAGREAKAKSTTPITIYEYYSPKDFPVIESYTDLSPEETIKRVIPAIVYTRQRKVTAKTQGFAIVLNDMPGKMRSITTRTAPTGSAPDGILISKKEFVYRTSKTYDPNRINELNSEVDLLTRNGYMEKGIMGMSYDIFTIMHEDFFRKKTRGIDFNLEGLPLMTTPTGAVIPIFAPLPYPDMSDHEELLKTAVTIKAIYKTGILERQIITEGVSTITTENLAFDQYTGEPLLTRTFNEFENPLYNYQYAAHWAYDAMGPAYKNTDFVCTSTSGTALDASAKVYRYNTAGGTAKFSIGDEVYVNGITARATGIVIAVGATSIDIQLAPTSTIDGVAGNSTITVIRSGKRNTLTSKVGSVLAEGFDYSNATQTFDKDHNGIIEASSNSAIDDKIISSGVIEYKKFDLCNPSCDCEVNPDLEALFQLISDNGYGNDNLDDISKSLSYEENQTANGFNCQVNQACQTIYDHLRLHLNFSNDPSFFVEYSKESNPTYRYSYTAEYLSAVNPSNFATYGVGGPIKANLLAVKGIYGTPAEHDYCTATCDEKNAFVLTIEFRDAATDQPIIVDVLYSPESECSIPAIVCETPSGYSSYASNIFKNILRPYRTFAYKAEKKYNDLTVTSNEQKKQGFYSKFSEFSWTMPQLSINNGWVVSNTMTKYDLNAHEIENKDAIGNYSAALFGYSQMLNTALAVNAQQREVAYDGFEDYSFSDNCPATSTPNLNNFNFRSEVTGSTPLASLSTTQSHTGNYSLKIAANQTASHTAEIYGISPSEECKCLSGFFPSDGKQYILSAWVKEENGPLKKSYVPSYSSSITVKYYNASNILISNQVLTTTGNIVDGWQKIEGILNIPLGASSMKVEMTGNVIRYYDDIRIHPFSSNIKTFVYHPVNFKLMAELDENNYATIYNYDDMFNLLKVKKETEDGIKTIQEGWSHKVKTETP